jgi:hypothetical protein
LRANASAILELGSFALPFDDHESLQVENMAPYAIVKAEGLASAIQGLLGFEEVTIDARLDESQPRRHLLADYHACPVLRAQLPAGSHTVAGMIWGGEPGRESQPWEMTAASAGEWQLDHPALGEWVIRHELLPAATVLTAR